MKLSMLFGKWCVALTFLFSLFFTIAMPASASTILQNGSFENLGGQTLSNGSWGILSNLPGWSSTTGLEVQTAGAIGLTPQNGNNYVELDGKVNTIAAQIPTLGIGRYMLSFWYSPRVASKTADMFFGIAGLTSGSVSALQYSTGQWTQITQMFTVTNAGGYTLYLGGAGRSDGIGALIDNVSIAPIPLPASGLLLLGAFVGLTALRRRKGAPLSVAG